MTDRSGNNFQIFLSYGSPDRDRVLPYYDYLTSCGYNVWMDVKRLKAGQLWDRQITQALDKSAIILTFVSNLSVNRRGYIQREQKFAADRWKEKLETDIFLIPVLLEELPELPPEIASFQCIRAWDGDAFTQIRESLEHQASQSGVNLDSKSPKEVDGVRWEISNFRETWEGIPGFEIDAQYLEFSSSRFKGVNDISAFLNGRVAEFIMRQRATKFSQMPEIFNFGQGKSSRSYTLDIRPKPPIFTGRVVSVQYEIYTFTLGAHGITSYCTDSFTLDPVIKLPLVQYLLGNDSEALQTIKNLVRVNLMARKDQDYQPDNQWITSGTETWDHFSKVLYRPDGIEFVFPEYQVDCFAAGPRSALIPYNAIAKYLQPYFLAALDMLHLKYQQA